MIFENMHSVVGYLNSLGLIAPLIAFFLFFVQAVVPIFPYFILAAAGGIVFGLWEGTLLAWLGALAGACFEFYLVRLTRWEWLHHWVKRKYDIDIGTIKPGWGFWTIFVARIFPVIPTPLINIVSAISGISFWVFFLSSALGKIPTAIIYTGLGNHVYLTEGLTTTAIVILVVLALCYLGAIYVRKRRIL